MERFSAREGVLLGYSSQRSLGSPNASSSSSSHGNSDVDFADVFGGPPRRSSIHEMQRSLSGSTDSRASSSQNPWTGLMEKPVFGEEVSSGRRHTSHDFFDDIFKSGGCSSSPRKNERDPIFSVPGSRALSPNQPLPPNAEPLSSSLPAQFSLPAKLLKGTELPTYCLGTLNDQRNKEGASVGINHYSYSPLSRSSSQTDRVAGELRNHVQAVSNHLCPKSLELSNLTTLDVLEEVGNSKMDSGTSDTLTNGSQFHFFIYKWVSKGVPIAMLLKGRNSSRLKETGKIGRCSSLKQTAREGMERDSPTANPNDTSFSIQLDKENVTLFDGISPGRLEGTQIFEEEVLPATESQTLSTHQIIGENIPANNNACAAAEKGKSQSLFEMNLHIEPEQDTSVFKKEAPKTEFDTLDSLLCNDNDGQGNDKMAAKNSAKERKSKTTKNISALIPSTAEKQNRGKPEPDTAEVGKDSLLDTSTTLEGSPGTNKIKGKVKNFVKIFNQDSLSKSKPDVNSQGHSYRRKDRYTSTKEDVLMPTTKAAAENMHVANVNQKKTPEAVTKVEESSMQTEKQDCHMQPKNYTPGGTSTGQINRPTSTQTSISGGLEAIGGDADELFSGDFLVIDSKIRQWSSGKDGNIRSLLSTLQYVLWPGSGWRSVPLVDIIEGNAVKRSYQKALLCLHPDKLQQKGASSQQKYTAEKVFDILQEAWTHFNSLGSL